MSILSTVNQPVIAKLANMQLVGLLFFFFFNQNVKYISYLMDGCCRTGQLLSEGHLAGGCILPGSSV